MNTEPLKPKKCLVPSEFENQAELYCWLKSMGLKVRGEVDAFIYGKPVRFDIAVFDDDRPIFAVEVKQKRGRRWRSYWLNTKQGAAYSSCGIPVYMVCGLRESELFRSSFLGLPRRPGVIWSDEWGA
jgi:hypothetical protein